MRALDVAAKAGAKTSTTFGVSIADEVVRFAKKNNVTRIVVGRPLKARWQEMLFGSVANQILRLSGPIDIVVISEVERTERESPEREGRPQARAVLARLFYCLWLVLGLTIFAMVAKSYISSTNLVMLYLIGVVLAAISWGLWPAIFTAAASVVTYDFFFVPPYFSFRISDSEYLITFGAFLFVGVVISLLVVRSRDYAAAAQRREDHTSILYALSMDLAAVNETQAVFETVSGHVRKACACRSAFFLPVNGLLTVSYANDGLDLDEKEMTAANWACAHGIRSGKDTDTLASATLKYYPLRTANGIVGVMGIQLAEQEGIFKMERERLIDAFASQTALAVERIAFWKQICGEGRVETTGHP
jgi:two-component system sensor histidine kinase KdpD